MHFVANLEGYQACYRNNLCAECVAKKTCLAIPDLFSVLFL